MILQISCRKESYFQTEFRSFYNIHLFREPGDFSIHSPPQELVEKRAWLSFILRDAFD